MQELKALYIIVNAGFASEVVEIAREAGATGATIINARGSVSKPKTILGITIDSEKEIVLSVVKKDVAIKIMEKVKEQAGVGAVFGNGFVAVFLLFCHCENLLHR